MSDSISATDVEIVDINQDINKKNMQIVIDDNDTDNDDDGNVAIQPIDMLVKENSKRIKEGGNDEKEIKSEAEEEEVRNINTIRDQVAENLTDSISTTDVEIVDINQDMNKKNMQIVIDDNDTSR